MNAIHTARALSSAPSRLGAHPVRGLSLIFALLALAVLSLAAIALVRSIDTGTLVLGNMGFKQDATASADQVADSAVSWLETNGSGTALDADDTAHGYLATAIDLDPTGSNTSDATRTVIDWAGNGCASYTGAFAHCVLPAPGPTINGHSTQYLIVRLCPSAGAPASGTNDCAGIPPALAHSSTNDADSVNSSVTRDGIDYFNNQRLKLSQSGSPEGETYFRVIARVVGGRKAVSYTETIVHF
jgi:hypothetical protein